MHLSLNNVNVQRIRWQWSWSVRWGRRAVRQSSLALLKHNVAFRSPGAFPAAPLCLRPTFLLWHTALAPHLIYTLAGEQVIAKKKNLCHSPFLQSILLQWFRRRLFASKPRLHILIWFVNCLSMLINYQNKIKCLNDESKHFPCLIASVILSVWHKLNRSLNIMSYCVSKKCAA